MSQLESSDRPVCRHQCRGRGRPRSASTGCTAQVGAVQMGIIALTVVVALIAAGAYWQTQQQALKKQQQIEAAQPAVTMPQSHTASGHTASGLPHAEPALQLYPAHLSLVTDARGQLVGCSGLLGDSHLHTQLAQQISAVFIEQYQPCDLSYDSAYQPDLMDINAVTRLAQIIRERPHVMIAINPPQMLPQGQSSGSKGSVVISTPDLAEFGKIEAAVREQTGNAFSLHPLAPVDIAQTVLQSVQTANQMLNALPKNPRPADITALLNQQIIRFGFDDATIPALNQPLLALVVPYLAQYPELQLQIRVFTSAVGSSQYSSELATRRAEAIRQAWIEQGVAADQLLAMGMGQQQPIAENATEQGQFWNERVAFRWVKRLVTQPETAVAASADVPKN